MKKCNKSTCGACPYIKEGKKINFGKFGENEWFINSLVNCNTNNLIYMIECNKQGCNLRYIGETNRTLRKRLSEHLGYTRSILPTKSTGIHFNLPGHKSENITITILEKMKNSDEDYRKERESYLIRKFNTYNNGLNKMP